MFFVPGAIIILLTLLLAIHLLRSLLSPELDQFIIVMLGIVPGKYMAGVISAFPGGLWAALPAFISYAFLHAGYTHLAINGAWLMAFGSLTVRKLGTPRFLALYLICAVSAGVVHVLVNPASLIPMIGASGAISGLMGAGFRMFLHDFLEGAGAQPHDSAMHGARQPVGLAPLNDRRFLSMSGAWILGNIVFGLTGIRVSEQVLMIAWDAHIAGFVTGALLIGLIVRTQKVSNVTSG
jgi:membrane associated rhomboid family serine protease